jgi:hypothetical protein
LVNDPLIALASLYIQYESDSEMILIFLESKERLPHCAGASLGAFQVSWSSLE